MFHSSLPSTRTLSDITRDKHPKTIFCDSSESYFVKNSIEFEKNQNLRDQGYGLNTDRPVPKE